MSEVVFEGIDVSQYNGEVNFDRVRAAGKTFVMIRAGWCGYDGAIQPDTKFDANMNLAAQNGMEVGVYLYNYAKTTVAVQRAAAELLNMLKPYQVTYPVALDMEDPLIQPLGKTALTDIAVTFLNAIEQGGYYAILYTSSAWMQSFLEAQRLTPYDWWIADWRSTAKRQPQWGMWQYMGSQGRVDGVTGPCDLDRAYKDYASIIRKNGLNHLNATNDLEKELADAKQEAELWKSKYDELFSGLQALLE